jgi:ABC-2 type transport system permease protein
MLTHALFIARKDLGWMLRQRETIAWVFFMPVLFFYFIGTVTGGFGATDPDRPDPIALLAAPEAGFLADEVARRLEQQNFRVVRLIDEQEAEPYTRQLILPAPADGEPTFTSSVLGGNRATLVLRRRGEGPAADFDRVRVLRAVYTVVADLAVVQLQDGEPDAVAFEELAAMPRALTLEVSMAGKRREVPTGYRQSVPGIMVMFTMLVLMTSGATMLAQERESGLLRRLASAPISRESVVLGKWAGRMGLGVVQLGVAMLLGWLLFDMQWGAELPMVSVVLFAWAALNASFAILLGNLARSPAQAAGIGVLATMVLAALGGAWWPIEVAPAFMQTLARFVPTGWTMEALHELVSYGYGAAAAAPEAAMLAVAAIVVGVAGARTFRYT